MEPPTQQPPHPVRTASAGAPALRIDHVAITVSSLELSLPYYAVLLGALGYERDGECRWHDGADTVLQFVEAGPGTRPYERYGAGMNHLGFRAASPLQVE